MLSSLKANGLIFASFGLICFLNLLKEPNSLFWQLLAGVYFLVLLLRAFSFSKIKIT